MNELIYLPYYSLNSQRIVLYDKLETLYKSEKNLINELNLKENKNKFNEISEKGKKNIERSINTMLFVTKQKILKGLNLQSGKLYKKPINYKLTFITLTLPFKQLHSDELIKSNLLNHFLKILRSDYKCLYYIWKAEKQQNNNIHFHILTNVYIDKDILRNDWNRIINKPKFGYVSKFQKQQKEYFKNGFKFNPQINANYATQFSRYKKALNENFLNPNSTDIHALYKIKNIASYMSKYLMKNVTKTNRIEKINLINQKLMNLAIKYQKHGDFILTSDHNIFSRSYSLKVLSYIIHKKEKLEKDKSKYLSFGVSGRCWSQSQLLSKLTNLKELENWGDIKDINLIKKHASFTSVQKINEREIYIVYFDITKTPTLYKKLLAHYKSIIQNYINNSNNEQNNEPPRNV